MRTREQSLKNPILKTDSYKLSHFLQLPPGSRYQSSYIESRGGQDWSIFFGLQMFIKLYLTQRITKEDVDEAEEIATAHGEPFNRAGFDLIVNEHDGYWPIRIQALPEGMKVPAGTPMVQMVNTDERLPWVTSFLETSTLRAVWYPTTVASKSKRIKNKILKALNLTSDDPLGQILFKLHDFGARGVSSGESAAIGGIAHLVNFMGTDTVEALMYGRLLYGENMAGFSIPAAEHSTITTWGGRPGEVDAFRNMLKMFAKPGALVAIVSDSYDIFNACSELWGGLLRQEVIDSQALVIIRPDSGDPATVVVKCLQLLAEKFGTVMNKKDFMVLNNVRIIQGDGITETSIDEIIAAVIAAGFSLDNVAFGMGGGLLQQCNRDDLKFAMKCSALDINSVWHDVMKDPITDTGKRSKPGRLAVYESSTHGIQTCREEVLAMPQNAGFKNLLQDVWVNGKLLVNHKFSEIRARSNA